jgi:hypothetical protein
MFGGIVSSISNWGLDGWMVEVAVEAEVADVQSTLKSWKILDCRDK